jgi:hypothetical protein
MRDSFCLTLCIIGPNQREHVLAKLRNPEPTMPQWKVTLAATKKTKKTAFSAKAFYDTGCGQCNKPNGNVHAFLHLGTRT